jgi:hypothetical protein
MRCWLLPTSSFTTAVMKAAAYMTWKCTYRKHTHTDEKGVRAGLSQSQCPSPLAPFHKSPTTTANHPHAQSHTHMQVATNQSNKLKVGGSSWGECHIRMTRRELRVNWPSQTTECQLSIHLSIVSFNYLCLKQYLQALSS